MVNDDWFSLSNQGSGGHFSIDVVYQYLALPVFGQDSPSATAAHAGQPGQEPVPKAPAALGHLAALVPHQEDQYRAHEAGGGGGDAEPEVDSDQGRDQAGGREDGGQPRQENQQLGQENQQAAAEDQSVNVLVIKALPGGQERLKIISEFEYL